ncbi:MAG TPA: PKD domain-containing protein [Flavobacterium sp.]|jgi:PKD repeat protein
MKKITLLIALIVSGVASAQVTYTSADFTSAGEEYTVSKASGFFGMNFASTGANHNWNFSELEADSQSTFGYQNPNNAGYKLSWCLSHFYIFTCNSQFNNNFKLATVLTDGFELMDYGVSNIVEHANVSSSAYENKMRGLTATISGISVPMTVDYDDPDEIYEFPMNYNDSYTTTGMFNLDLNSLGVAFQYTLETERTNTVQGWGSLTTPMGTFPNVLKLKTVLQKTETIVYEGIELPIPTTTVSYQWFSKDYGIPVLQADGMELFGFFIPVSVTYLDEQQCLTPDASFTFLPVADYNPETQVGTVSFNNLSTNYTGATWDFGDGQTSTSAIASHDYSCPGTYNVTLTVSNDICSPGSSDTFTLPVVVTDSQNAFTTNVTLEGSILTAERDLAGTTYQWVDCDNGNALMVGETGQSFMATADGNYACILTTNGCESLSACTNVTLLNTNQNSIGSIRLYPNPTTGLLQLSGNLAVKNVQVYNTLGMLVADKLDISGQSAGIYFVKVTTEEGSFIRKVIKE